MRNLFFILSVLLFSSCSNHSIVKKKCNNTANELLYFDLKNDSQSVEEKINGENFFIIRPDSLKDDTDRFKLLFLTHSNILIKKGKYFLQSNKICLGESMRIIGEPGVKIYCLQTKNRKCNPPPAVFTTIDPLNIELSGVTFIGNHNTQYGIRVLNSDFMIQKTSNIRIYNNDVFECGLIYVGPEKGFTFNRKQTIKQKTWHENGTIYKNYWLTDIQIYNNTMKGDIGYSSGNFTDGFKGVSGITIQYANNIKIYNNIITNYRFGIWVYGGSSISRNKTRLSTNPILAKNIEVNDNIIYETYSPIWFSKAQDIYVYNNSCVNNQDVALDFEGCANALVFNNKVKNSRGGALTVLNGCINIVFTKNKVLMFNFNNENNIIFIRDNNREIIYNGNTFVFKDNRRTNSKPGRIFFKSSSSSILCSSRIIFKNNYYSNVIFENRDLSDFTVTNTKNNNIITNE